MAASRRASARRCWRTASMTIRAGQLLTGSLHGLLHAAGRRSAELQGRRRTRPCARTIRWARRASAKSAPSARTPAVINAVLDALSPLGVQDISMPATPLKVWQAIQGAQQNGSGIGGGRSCMISHITGRPPRRTPPALLAKNGEAKIVAGGMTLIPTLKQRLAQPSDLVDLGGIAELKGVKARRRRHHHRRHDHPRRRGALGRRAEDHPRPRRAGGRDRRSASAQSRHHRRLGRQQRSGGGLPGRRARPRRDHPHQQARDQGRRLLQGHVRDGACRMARSSPPSISRSRTRRAIPSSRTRPRAMPSSAYLSQRPAAACASR